MFRAPNYMPLLSTIVADLPVTPVSICTHLDISPATWRRYVAADSAPRPIMLSLFWETRWGRSAADVDAANAAMYATQHAAMLRAQNLKLHAIIDELERERTQLGIMAANAPFFRAV